MAKIHNYFVLCPLIDQKSFLGVAEDKTGQDALVTLGRNVVNKYQLSDQKQLSGWTSKDHITSPVIYDHELKSYVGVFNKTIIKTWTGDSDNLDKLKKHKFSLNIMRLIPHHHKSSLVLFGTGDCLALPYALDNRKIYQSKPLLKDSDTIVEAGSYTINETNYICYIIKNNRDAYEIVYCPLREEIGDMDRTKLVRVKVTRNEDVSVVGKFINTRKSPAVYILWSDGKMAEYNFKEWKTVGSVPWVSTKSTVSLAWMGKNHVVIFGSNTDQDGAIIVAYNIILGVGSCKYQMKMYTEDAKLYCFSGRIILEASNHIGMLPFALETKRNLSSLLGSHEVVENESMDVANWDSPTNLGLKLDQIAMPLVNLGLTERSICNTLIPSLLEKKDYQKVNLLLKQLHDIPESVLVSLLNYVITEMTVEPLDITDDEAFINYCSGEGQTKAKLTQLKGRLQILNELLHLSFSDILIIPHLRNGLSLDSTLFLMMYLRYLLLSSDTITEDNFESKIFDWYIILMDAFYQQYVMCKDEKVTKVLQSSLDLVLELMKQYKHISNTMPRLYQLVSGKKIESNVEVLPYTIELMVL